MKYEEIKIGESYLSEPYVETVIFKHDKTKSIVCEDQNGEISIYNSDEFEDLKPLKEELPEEGLLVSETGGLVYRLSGSLGYGFLFGSQLNYIFNNRWKFSSDGYWKPATPEQESNFIEMLKKECYRRGLYEDTKIEKNAEGLEASNINVSWLHADVTEIFNRNGRIFYKGNFATPIKEEESTLDQVTDAVKDIANFTIEESPTGLIILTPIKK